LEGKCFIRGRREEGEVRDGGKTRKGYKREKGVSPARYRVGGGGSGLGGGDLGREIIKGGVKIKISKKRKAGGMGYWKKMKKRGVEVFQKRA